MLKNVTDLTTPGVNRGLNTQYNLLAINKEQSPNMMNVKVTYDGSTEKRLGSNTQNSVAIAESGLASFTTTNELTNGLVSWWNLNELSGTRKDGYDGNNLTDGGTTGYSGGMFSQAAEFFTNSGNYLYKNSASILKITTNDVSMSCWFYLYNTGNSAFIYKSDYDPTYGIGGIDTNALLVAHCNTEDFPDSSLYEWDNPGKQGNPQADSDAKFGASSCYSSGNGNKLQYQEDNVYNIGTGNWTLEFWCKRGGGGVQQFPIGLPYRFRPSFNDNDGRWEAALYNNGVSVANKTLTPNLGSGWRHIAFVRSGSTLTLYQDGTQGSSTVCTETMNNVFASTNGGVVLCGISTDTSTSNDWTGYLDEVRFSNIARYTTDFTVNTKPFSFIGRSMEYLLGVDTASSVFFGVSSSGTALEETVYATSFGAVSTATWYNAYAYYNSAGQEILVAVNGTADTVASTGGVFDGQGTFSLGAVVDGGSSELDGRLDEVGFWQNPSDPTIMPVTLYNTGTGASYNPAFEAYPWACFDFGASSLRWLTCGAGTAVYASSDLGVNWAMITSDRSATYQYYDRSKNVMVMTSENYDIPMYWAGSAGTQASVLNHSGPNCKYNVNFSGYLILLNSEERKRSFNYIDENLQLTGSGWLNFDIPSSADDEITAVFVLRRYLYVCTRYKIYRVSYVGGNPDWQYVEVKNWGFVPRTVKKVVLSANKSEQGVASYSIGEVVVGLAYDRKLRIFDGSGDQIISNNIELDNKECPFALNKISYFGSGPLVSFAEIDQNENVYKLCLAIGENSDQTTHMINYDGRSQALYPYDNQQFNCMTMAESSNKRILLAFDRSGFCHMLDSGNLDGNTTPVDEYFESPILFEKTPSQASKAHTLDIFFTNRTAGPIYFEQRSQFGDAYKLHNVFNLNGSDRTIISHERIDVPLTTTAYQFKISSSSGTFAPWQMQRYDYFTQGLGIGAEAKRG